MGTTWVVPPLTEGEILAMRRVLRRALSDTAANGFAPGRQTAALRTLGEKVALAAHMNEGGNPVQKKGPANRLDKVK
jgi:hypothetical protein